MNPEFWAGRRVLLTGHTGFKGVWTCALLETLGAEVHAFALPAEGNPNLWALIGARLGTRARFTDLRDAGAVEDACIAARPQVVLHMAAQAQVRRSYAEPRETHSSNLMGTVNLLESLRRVDGIDAILVVTSDKVYANSGDGRAFAEDHALGGSDPYSASKAAVEIVSRSYAESFFAPQGVLLATARGGNVVGGGDFSSDRLVPDVFRAAQARKPVALRYPEARRPWQHVLDCVSGYLLYAEHLSRERFSAPSALNFGPSAGAEVTVAELAELMSLRFGNPVAWERQAGDAPPEKAVLRLDARRAREALGWSPRLDLAATVEWTADWYAAFAAGEDPLDLTRAQIARYLRAASSVSA